MMKSNTIQFFYLLANGFLLITGVLHLLTFLPQLDIFGQGLLYLIPILIILPFVSAVQTVQKQNNNDPASYFTTFISVFWTKQNGTLFLYIFVTFIYCLLILNKGLEPKEDFGFYGLWSKGALIEEITEEQYYRHSAYLFRAVSGVALGFIYNSVNLLRTVRNSSIEEDGKED